MTTHNDGTTALDILRFVGAVLIASLVVGVGVEWFTAGGFWYFR